MPVRAGTKQELEMMRYIFKTIEEAENRIDAQLLAERNRMRADEYRVGTDIMRRHKQRKRKYMHAVIDRLNDEAIKTVGLPIRALR